jgi:hypothetical protein
MSIPSRDQFLFTESFDSLMNSNIVGGRDNKPSPGDALHQEALEYLKTTLKLKELEARAYKSIAYRHIKESNPEAKHFERAEKMLELVKNKNFVKEYKDKLAETMKILEDIDSEKAKRNSETASQVSTEEKVSRRMRRRQSGGNFSETSVDANYTDTNANKPFYNEYRAMKAQYLQAKQMGGNNLSETSVMQNYTESNATQPYYKEYLQAKKQYLEAKLNQKDSEQGGGGFNPDKWKVVQPSFGFNSNSPMGQQINPTNPLHNLTQLLEIIKEDLMPNLMQFPGALNPGGYGPPQAVARQVDDRERVAAVSTFLLYVDEIKTKYNF